ncbi:MAG: imidazole glycerol phosphate synthase subunit HisH [Myxococcales bacterium]|nr:imidazole glycerol phosphate synthase subunit HisH [Myxococcales bacterium]
MIAIVDVCGGNLRSVAKALATVGGDVVVTRDPDVVAAATKVVVPGQGAFAPFMRGLVERGLEAPIRTAIDQGVPYLGICLGLQVLFDESEEHGPVRGLALVPGKVVRFRPTDHAIKVPHMGWNRIVQHAPDPLLRDLDAQTHYYFVHSFYAVPDDPALVVLSSDHGAPFCAAIRAGNVFACQFHPEKSQRAGLDLLAAFVAS